METINFTVNGRPQELSRTAVEAAMKDVDPEPVRSHAVIVVGKQYPVKQAFALATGLDRLDFTSAVARRHLDRLGFELLRASGPR